jgi:Uma2 family endonuclease
MSPSAEHEWYNRLLSDLVKLLARELRVDILDLGSTTFKLDWEKQGFEPDSCFYVTNIRKVRGKERIDTTVDPPPDIVIEVVVTHPSVSKFPLCAAFGVPEIWTYDGSRLAIFQLQGTEYAESASSRVLRELNAKQLGEFLELGKTLCILPKGRHPSTIDGGEVATSYSAPLPAVAWACWPRWAGAGRSRDSGQDARVTKASVTSLCNSQ